MNVSRRRFLESSLAASAVMLDPGECIAGKDEFKIAPFRFDVTPPVGHPLCGGWITPMQDCEDPLEAIGFVFLGAGKPFVICAVDWTGILNDAHGAWRDALADAAGTTDDRVAVQCVHQHDAPFVCQHAEKLVGMHGLHLVEMEFFRACLSKARAAVKAAIPFARRVTHLASGDHAVLEVAANRRIARDAAGKVLKMRGSSCRDPELIAMPEGLIDPMLKTVALFDGEEKVLACHYYATHPMSHYGKGQVSSDFVGLARKRTQREDPGCTHLYFTGCAGNIAAGKYNDGSPEARLRLTERIREGIAGAGRALRREAIVKVEWKTHAILPPANPVFPQEELQSLLADERSPRANRTRAAMTLGWMQRLQNQTPVILSALHLNDVAMLHLPAECFVEYQLRAQEIGGAKFIATAAYGDGGPWYIPVKEEYPHDGYEVSVANCAPAVDDILTEGMRAVLAP